MIQKRMYGSSEQRDRIKPNKRLLVDIWCLKQPCNQLLPCLINQNKCLMIEMHIKIVPTLKSSSTIKRNQIVIFIKQFPNTVGCYLHLTILLIKPIYLDRPWPIPAQRNERKYIFMLSQIISALQGLKVSRCPLLTTKWYLRHFTYLKR